MKTILAILLCISLAYAQFQCQENPGKVSCATPKINVLIEGNLNVPKFTVSRFNSTTTYKVQFTTSWQTASDATLQKIGGTNVALASYSWTMGKVSLAEQLITFTLTGTGAGSPTFEFGISIGYASNAMKFNVTISNMNGLWSNDAKFLVLCYKIIEQGGAGAAETNPNPVANSATKASFGNAFFSIVSTAKDNTGATKNVQMKTTTEGNANSICTIYEKFDAKLVHDPELGVNSVARAALSLLVLALVLVINLF